MLFNIFRHLHRSKLYVSGIYRCSRKLHRISSLQNKVVQSNVIENKEIGEDLHNDMSASREQDRLDPLDYDDYFNVADLVNLKELFDARVHLGHHEGAYDPLTRPYIYRLRATQHIIDLNMTVECLKHALNVLSHIVYRRGIVCFVSSNPRYDYLIQKTARSSGEYFITRDWNKGTLLNASKRLKTDRLPDLLIAFNLSRFETIREAVTEAAMINIPVIGIIDTDCDPRLITYPVPGNDDTMDSVAKLCDIFGKAIINAKEKLDIDEEADFKSRY